MDMLARIRNAGIARHAETRCPSSRLKQSIAKVLQEAGFLGDVRVDESGGHPELIMQIRYVDRSEALIGGIRRISRPGRRVYVGSDEVPKVRNGLGVAVVSTSQGIMTDAAARAAGQGGEILCIVT